MPLICLQELYVLNNPKVCNNSNMTSATNGAGTDNLSGAPEHNPNGAGTDNPSGAPEYNPDFSGVRYALSLLFYVMFCGSLLVLALCHLFLFLVILLFVFLRLTAYDYSSFWYHIH